jgi:trimeric autotransporter adhesin
MQPAILWRFFVSKHSHFRKTQLAIALTATLAAGNVFAVTVDNAVVGTLNVDGTLVPGTGDADVYNQAAVGGVPINTTVSDTNGPNNTTIVLLNDTYTSTTKIVTAVVGRGDQVVQQTGMSGLAVLENGNLTLTGGTSQLTTTTTDYANITTIEWNSSNNQSGNVISELTNVPGVYNAVNSTFTQNANGAVVVGPVTKTGGNLTMDGTATIGNGAVINGSATQRALTVNGSANQTVAAQINSNGSTRALDVNGAMHVNANNGNTTLYADANGVTATGTGATMKVNGTNAQLTNSNGKGVVVTNEYTTLSGGSGSTYLHMMTDQAKFSKVNDPLIPSSAANAVRVTGVADGVNQYDAVNYGQVASAYNGLKRDIKDVESKAYGGIASAVALAGIPAPAAGKTYTVGVGWGNYEGENAFALGGRAQVTPEFQLTAGWGYSNEGNAFNVGAGYSW